MSTAPPTHSLAGPAVATATPRQPAASDTVETPAVGAGATESELARIVELAPASALSSGCLCFEDEFGGFVIVPIARPAMRIGRGLAADVSFEDPTVSRRHALLARDGDDVRVLDDRSLNGLFVNGMRVRSRLLEDGDVISVGRHRLHYAQRPQPERREETGAPALQAA
jgi:hypothetical protein